MKKILQSLTSMTLEEVRAGRGKRRGSKEKEKEKKSTKMKRIE